MIRRLYATLWHLAPFLIRRHLRRRALKSPSLSRALGRAFRAGVSQSRTTPDLDTRRIRRRNACGRTFSPSIAPPFSRFAVFDYPNDADRPRHRAIPVPRCAMSLPALRQIRMGRPIFSRTPPHLRHFDGNRNLAQPDARLPRSRHSPLFGQRAPLRKIPTWLPQNPQAGRACHADPLRLLCPNRRRCRTPAPYRRIQRPRLRQHQIRHRAPRRLAPACRRL